MFNQLSYIHPGAKIGKNCTIEPFVYIDDNVVIGDNCHIMAHASVLSGTRMGNGNRVFHGAVVGGIPQDLKFVGEKTTAEIGDYNDIRECVTISRGTASKGKTVVGSHNLLFEKYLPSEVEKDLRDCLFQDNKPKEYSVLCRF